MANKPEHEKFLFQESMIGSFENDLIGNSIVTDK